MKNDEKFTSSAAGCVAAIIMIVLLGGAIVLVNWLWEMIAAVGL
jgi:hypothetical protein